MYLGNSKRLESGLDIRAKVFGSAILAAAFVASGPAEAAPTCSRTLTADVVAFDTPLMWNRLGAQNINGVMYALRRDVVDKNSLLPESQGGVLAPGQVTLRPDKRPRPLVLRMAVGDCLSVEFQNLLTPLANPFAPVEVRSGVPFNLNINNQVAERYAGINATGVQLVESIADDSSFVGKNANSLAAQGETRYYTWYGGAEGTFVLSSDGVTFGGEGQGGNTAGGLFGALTVEATPGSGFYRSQLTREELDLATTGATADGHPIIDYEATYPFSEPWTSEGRAGLPILNMVTPAGEYVHSDLNAIVAYAPTFQMETAPYGPSLGKLGHFPPTGYPLEYSGLRNPTVPNRTEPFREFTVIFHDEAATSQAFPEWYGDPVMKHTLHGVRDSFMINYGSGGIGSEIIASRLGVGPMHDCINCAYEEFFLTAFTVGDVGMLVDVPANIGLELCDPALNNCEATGPKANYALFPDDPSNVHHGYTGDSTAFRNLHAGPGEQHVFHLHNHQWLFSANDDNANYIDAQGLGPGSGYSYWVNFGGAGNRNKTAGDAIFHCHFYPHFAQGMWEMWRIHDTFEQGTAMQASLNGGGAHTSFTVDGIGIGNGTPAPGARALPDGEIVAGTPIPAVVPLPGRAMPPMPAPGVTVKPNPNLVAKRDPVTGLPELDATGAPIRVPTGSLAAVPDRTRNPGYPFWIAGIEHTVGQRPTTPPLDMITSSQAGALKSSGEALWQHPGLADPDAIDGWDGGLPRYSLEGYAAGSTSAVAVTRLDFTKEIKKAKPVFYPEEGTDLEQVAMAYHAQRCHDSFLPDGTPANCDIDDTGDGVADRGGYILNGNLPVPGAPYNEPCMDDQGRLLDGSIVGNFFSSELVPRYDPAGMNTHGASPHDATDPRVYKAANVQFDAVFNKLGYHFPQQRIIALWQDVVPTIEKRRPPEPFVLRMNTFDCTQYVHTNLVPKVYELDDYQVRTPTDIIGQHIHLPKWDLTSADGSANGWNYEDGTLSPEMVVEIIEAINVFNEDAEIDSDPATHPVTKNVAGGAVIDSSGHSLTTAGLLEPADHPFFGGTPFALQWRGARSTLQRWFADPVVNVQGVDRGLGIIFTHDHYGPSTHQQVGLYATVLIEPAGSKWVHNETGEQLGQSPDGSHNPGRVDGGPTSWQAAILTGNDGFGAAYAQNVRANKVEDHREFYFEYTDFQHAYQPGVYVGAGPDGFALHDYDASDADGDGFIDAPLLAGQNGQGPAGLIVAADTFRESIQPSFRQQAPLGADGFPTDVWIFPPFCPNDVGGVQVNNIPRPCPEAISADDPGMYVVNYRNESLAARIYDPYRLDCPDGKPGCQAKGRKGDLAFAMQTRTDRAIPMLNKKLGGKVPQGYKGDPLGEVFLPPINQLSAVKPGDPFTPMMRAFDGDRVHVKVQAGGQEEEHTKILHGLKWLQAGSGFGEAKNSGWRNAQAGGISEQFTFRSPVFGDLSQMTDIADYAYSTNASIDGWTTGTWGVLRSYRRNRGDLVKLPNNDPRILRRILNNLAYDDDDEEDEDGNVLSQYKGVCPVDAPKRFYDITAVLANEVLPRQPVGVVSTKDPYPNSHMGRSPKKNRRTLVYNPRATVLDNGMAGPLHDPTALLYVHTGDLKPIGLPNTAANRRDPTVPVKLRAGVPIEPPVLRAKAGECIKVRLRNRLLRAAETLDGGPVFNVRGKRVFECRGPLFADQATTISLSRDQVVCDQLPDLASGNAIMAMVRRDPGAGAVGMTSFQNNLMLPSAHVGLHPTLVEYDVTRADGTNVGQNPVKTVAPGRKRTYTWYAGHLETAFQLKPNGKIDLRTLDLTATPVEFGGFNLMPADKIKQAQKGMIGAGVVLPPNVTWVEDADDPFALRNTRTAALVTRPSGKQFRDFTTVWQKGASMFYADSQPIENVEGEGSFGVSEDSQDMGHMAINYGTEPLWYRFGLAPCGEGSCDNVADAHMAYSNSLVGSDPVTPVFTAAAGDPFRMHVLMPIGPGRGTTYDLHGHVWQRDPYKCPGENHLGLAGKCKPKSVGSRALGKNPVGHYLGGIESVFPGEHYEVVVPKAGGAFKVPGDYLFRDHMGLGNVDGLWGIVRVE